MKLSEQSASRDHAGLLEALAGSERLLVIQDLDGVCMGLVRDPLDRQMDPDYVLAARRLEGEFMVLTNGEHIGTRGVNGVIERAFEPATRAAEEGLYLPGLAAGGVQLQDRFGNVSHPGVSEAELEFLRAVPDKLQAFFRSRLSEAPYALSTEEVQPLASAAVLDNLVSPTANLNVFFDAFRGKKDLYGQLQREVAGFVSDLQAEARAEGLGDAFFVHYAPNLGRDESGQERLQPATETHSGTHDIQFMLRGAVKEVGVLVALNRYYHDQTGSYPLGEGFNAREAPRDHGVLLKLAEERFDRALMPRIIGVGDTVSSNPNPDGSGDALRGGSDRGFLTLVQDLGKTFGTDNAVLFVDSSGGEVTRPSIDVARLEELGPDETWKALEGITDAKDPLRLSFVFPEGHVQYTRFFEALADRRKS